MAIPDEPTLTIFRQRDPTPFILFDIVDPFQLEAIRNLVIRRFIDKLSVRRLPQQYRSAAQLDSKVIHPTGYSESVTLPFNSNPNA